MKTRILLGGGIVALALVPLLLVDHVGTNGPTKVNTAIQNTGQQSIKTKTNSIVIPSVDFENTSIQEALDFLTNQARELDPAQEDPVKGIRFVIREPMLLPPAREHREQGPLRTHIESLRVSIKGKDMTLADVLDRICREAGLRWHVADDNIVLEPLD